MGIEKGDGATAEIGEPSKPANEKSRLSENSGSNSLSIGHPEGAMSGVRIGKCEPGPLVITFAIRVWSQFHLIVFNGVVICRLLEDKAD